MTKTKRLLLSVLYATLVAIISVGAGYGLASLNGKIAAEVTAGIFFLMVFALIVTGFYVNLPEEPHE